MNRDRNAIQLNLIGNKLIFFFFCNIFAFSLFKVYVRMDTDLILKSIIFQMKYMKYSFWLIYNYKKKH